LPAPDTTPEADPKATKDAPPEDDKDDNRQVHNLQRSIDFRREIATLEAVIAD
jgi:hypothetical protein